MPCAGPAIANFTYHTLYPPPPRPELFHQPIMPPPDPARITFLMYRGFPVHIAHALEPTFTGEIWRHVPPSREVEWAMMSPLGGDGDYDKNEEAFRNYLRGPGRWFGYRYEGEHEVVTRVLNQDLDETD
ncbi:hypothetical protein ABW19_dt0209563 [Dactylella cylindrospora]|nr:hypothetical protein ABW19_dt0209563 [Dactylella cylindrospora]